MKKNSVDSVSTKISEIIALKLWETGAVKINFEKPFKLVSGKFSPIYINCRLLISDPEFCSLFNSFSKILLKNVKFDVIAGGESAGIPYAAFLATSYSLPMIYIRKKPKDYGMGNLIEGTLGKGQQVLLVEDLITDSGSKINFIDAINQAGGMINDVLVVFDRKQGGADALAKVKIKLHAMCDIDQVLNIGLQDEIINNKEFDNLVSYLKS